MNQEQAKASYLSNQPITTASADRFNRSGFAKSLAREALAARDLLLHLIPRLEGHGHGHGYGGRRRDNG
jgi:hypothetical protein